MQQPNIIFIMTDTQATNMIGCYAGQDLNTNHIDTLADNAVRFNSAFTTSPVCTPARAGIFTGIFAQNAGPWSNNLPLGKNIRTMGQYFKEAGYKTAYVGKWHLDGHDYFGTGICPDEWDKDYWYDGINYLNDLKEEEIPLWRNGLNSLEDIEEHEITAAFTWAHRISNWGIDFLSKQKEKSPFLLVLSYDEPHHPFTCPAEYIRKYQDFAYDLHGKQDDDLSTKPAHQRHWSEAMGYPQSPDGKYRHPLYFACNDFVDDEIGRVLDSLSDEDRKNTWIIFTSDHGEMMGAHRLISKGANAYDDIARIPLIIQPPLNQLVSQQIETPVSHIDLLPTMLDIAGIKAPDILQGESLLPLVTGSNPNKKYSVMVSFNRYEIEHDSFGGFIPMRAWVSDDYKLVINLFDTDELYDRKNDPYEMHNLIDDPQYAAIRNKLHDDLYAYMEKTRDSFRTYQFMLRPWRDDKGVEWMGLFRPKPDDGISPIVRDYDTGLKTKGVKTEKKNLSF